MVAMSGDSEATITFYNESWTTEVVQLLLEVDEGWMGYYHDATWSWHEETYKTFVAICRERQWPYNSSAACKAMLQALRTSAFSIKLSNARCSSDGYAQWSLPEMRELGAQMRRVADDVSQAMPWAEQFEIFKQTVRTKDLNFTIDGRTVEDFAARADKFVPYRTLLLINPDLTQRKRPTPIRMRATQRSPILEPARQMSRQVLTADSDRQIRLPPQSQPLENAVDSENNKSYICTRTNSMSTMEKLGRKRAVETARDTWEHNRSSEREGSVWRDYSTSQRSKESTGSMPFTHTVNHRDYETSSYVESERQLNCSQNPIDQGQFSHPQTVDPSRSSSATRQMEGLAHQDPWTLRRAYDGLSRQTSRYQDLPPLSAYSRQNEPLLPQEDFVDQERSANGTRKDNYTPPQQPTRKYQRVQQSTTSDRVHMDSCPSTTKSDEPPLFRNLNPYDRPGKPWGEFVVEVLLAERTARNEDELDYVQFVRGLYEI